MEHGPSELLAPCLGASFKHGCAVTTICHDYPMDDDTRLRDQRGSSGPPELGAPLGAAAQPGSPCTLRVKSFSEEPAGFSATHM